MTVVFKIVFLFVCRTRDDRGNSIASSTKENPSKMFIRDDEDSKFMELGDGSDDNLSSDRYKKNSCFTVILSSRLRGCLLYLLCSFDPMAPIGMSRVNSYDILETRDLSLEEACTVTEVSMVACDPTYFMKLSST